ncbi:helix-turn-helix protein [Chitinophaga dinghuensis]|uniref:Helix-turn-helix protein n=1 Tax=Chitinophaga dinghuensis TaxID=1539050 RepID=A0A327W9E7_9BACT|nr:helix-turn-helix transcriptional regulator [Chitinophaga dinghuensis]RAJ85862.1 helix-turn-helix protein [Chitinophaga dinghuensis]
MSVFEAWLIVSFVSMNFNDTDYIKAWGANLRTIRKKQKMTILELAVAMEVDEKQIRRIEKGEVNTSLGMIRAISIALGIEPGELFKF